jgi:hypothetical protein
MSGVDTGDPTPTQEQYTEIAKEEEKVSDSQKIHAVSDRRLRDLAQSDELYSAMENFLLGDPKRQLPILDVDRLIQEGKEAQSSGETVMARTKFETAAKVELYRRNKQNLQQDLELAQGVTDSSDQHSKLQKSLLDNIDQALEVAQKYYDDVPGASQG